MGRNLHWSIIAAREYQRLRGDGIVEEARSLRRGGWWPVAKPPVQSGGVNGEKTMTKAGQDFQTVEKIAQGGENNDGGRAARR